jgi:hypothetical protein
LVVPLQAGDGRRDVGPWHGDSHEGMCRGLANRPSQNSVPRAATTGASVSGPRLFAITTFLPARSAVRARARPMCPAPKIPTVAVRSVVGRSNFKSSHSP